MAPAEAAAEESVVETIELMGMMLALIERNEKRSLLLPLKEDT